MARTGFSWLTVDIEHTLVSWETATHMFASIADANGVPLARVPSNRHDHIKRALDNGAFGVVVPMVNSRQEALDAVSAMLRADKTKSLQLDGHASAEGTDAYNMQLSLDRANAVKTYLVNSGVDAKRISTTGYGETRPIASNTTEEGKVANRRVEFRQK